MAQTPADPRAREMAGAGRQGLLCLPRRADQLGVDPGFPSLRWSTFGAARSRDGAKEAGSHGNGSSRSPMTFSQEPRSFIPGRSSASPSDTQGRSRMPESGTYGSVRGVAGNSRPYRECRPIATAWPAPTRGARPKDVCIAELAHLGSDRMRLCPCGSPLATETRRRDRGAGHGGTAASRPCRS